MALHVLRDAGVSFFQRLFDFRWLSIRRDRLVAFLASTHVAIDEIGVKHLAQEYTVCYGPVF